MGRMVVPPLALLLSGCPAGLAFSSHFGSDGALLSELTWPSSLAVVAVSFSGLITIIFLMLACLCCKKGDIGFKELDNVEGEDYTTEFSIQSTPAAQNGPEVYVLPLTEVSVPMSKQPGRSVQLHKSSELGRQSLLYLKEIGHGWFGKVLLGEVNAGLSSTQVVVRELKVSASVQEQMTFLEETQPYRALQHPNLLQCLAQCTEITPYLLVMEFCPLGDVKGYLQSCAASESTTPDPLTLQRMGCEVCCGLLHLHKNNFTHSDLALRNCLLAADLTVKIGDYGLAHSKYREDYLVTSDQLWVPLRWIAPELIDEVHGNLLLVDQTKASNIWSLGVALWELFELGRQPYESYSDRQVLSYVVKEQQLKLPKPQLKQLQSDRWYEVMQFCWLQPEQRPTVEEVHLLLTYLSVKGSGELEEEFEKRWNSMKPNCVTDSGGHHEPELSSYPLLEHFTSDGFQSDGDDVLTVTQTSQGLNFEYKWERGRHEPYPLSPGCQPYQDAYYAAGAGDQLSLGVSPSGYDGKDCGSNSRPLELVPVLSARSPSVAGDYFIRIEEPLGSNLEQDYSPQEEELQGVLTEDSPSISLSMEPLLEQVVCSAEDNSREKPIQSQHSSPSGEDEAEETQPHRYGEDNWVELSGFDDPLGVSSSLNPDVRPHVGDATVTPETQDSREDQTDFPTVQNDEDVEYGAFQQDLGPLEFSSHWASNVSSNNNVSSAPQEQVGMWCNRRLEDTREDDSEPYGPESWQIAESGEADNATATTVAEDQYYDAQEFVGEECLVTEETSFAKKTDPKSLTIDSTCHALASPCIEEEASAKEMDPTHHLPSSPESIEVASDKEMDPTPLPLASPDIKKVASASEMDPTHHLPSSPDIEEVASAKEMDPTHHRSSSPDIEEVASAKEMDPTDHPSSSPESEKVAHAKENNLTYHLLASEIASDKEMDQTHHSLASLECENVTSDKEIDPPSHPSASSKSKEVASDLEMDQTLHLLTSPESEGVASAKEKDSTYHLLASEVASDEEMDQTPHSLASLECKNMNKEMDPTYHPLASEVASDKEIEPPPHPSASSESEEVASDLEMDWILHPLASLKSEEVASDLEMHQLLPLASLESEEVASDLEMDRNLHPLASLEIEEVASDLEMDRILHPLASLESEEVTSVKEMHSTHQQVASPEEVASAKEMDRILHPLASPESEEVNSIKEMDSTHQQLASPESEEVASAKEMDPLGVGFIGNSEAPTRDLEITEEDISISGSQGASLQSLSDEHCNHFSAGKVNETPEKLLSKDFYQTSTDSEDEDTMELTSGVFTDLSSERGDAAPSFRSLQKQVGTPDSLDSLDMPSTASSCDTFSLGTYAPSALHKALDSGYDTENYESPEFVLKEPQESKETGVYYQQARLDPGDMSMSRSVSSELGLDAKNPYRDSAYFSDYDSFNREEEEEGERNDEMEQRDEPSKSASCTDICLKVTSDLGEIEENLTSDDQVSSATDVEEVAAKCSSPPLFPVKEVSLLQPPLIVREESVDEGLGLECHKDSVLENKPNASSAVKSTAHRTFTLSPVQLCLTKACTVKQGAPGSITLTTGLQAEDELSSNRESLGTPHMPKCVSPPLIRKENRAGDSTEDDDEDEESEDSDESDEELRSYNIQEHSEESEEEHAAVPIVITDNSSASHLRSLLKTPQPAPEESDRKKKAVSFYNDVTVYLFDQESPTLDLAEQEIPEMPPVVEEVKQITFKEPNNHLLGGGGGGGLEWDGEMALKPVKTSFITSLSPAMRIPEVTGPPEPPYKPALPVQLSRFSVSPTPLSRFSITHVADHAIGAREEKVQSGEKI